MFGYACRSRSFLFNVLLMTQLNKEQHLKKQKTSILNKRGHMAEINYLLIIAQFLIIAGLSSIIGWEREKSKSLVKGTAGLRTHMIVGIAATLLTIISIYGFSQYENADPGRIVSYIVMGIGFLGAGTIMAHKGEVIGLTTAASIWLVSAIGIAVGLGLYIVAIITTVFAWIILELWRVEKDIEEGNQKGISKLLPKK